VSPLPRDPRYQGSRLMGQLLVSTAPSGSGGSESIAIAKEVLAAVAVTKKAAEMRIAEEVMAVKVAEEVASVKVVADKAATVKVAADKAVAEKVVVDKATTMKAAEEAVVKAVMDVATMKTAGQGAATVKTNVGPLGSGSSPSSVVGFKRAAAPCDSTPPSKLFHYAWKPQYTEQLCSHLLLFIYLN
jgi:hypothetical protein